MKRQGDKPFLIRSAPRQEPIPVVVFNQLSYGADADEARSRFEQAYPGHRIISDPHPAPWA